MSAHPDLIRTEKAEEKKTNLAVTIIVVSFNTKQLTLGCLDSIFRETQVISFEVLLVDNNSSDGSADAVRDAFPQVRLFALDENLGFGAANNYAAQYSNGDYLVLLNPDTVVLDGAIEKIVAYAQEHPGSGIVGGRTLSPDGSLDPTSCWAKPSLWSLICQACCFNVLLRGNAIFDPESMGNWARDTEREVDVVTGCFLLISKDLWDSLDGFDEQYFMYGEDSDLSLRALRLGFRSVITPTATVTHYGGASEPIKEDKQVRLLTAQVLLLRSHWTPLRAEIGVRLLLLGVCVRAFGSGLVGLIRVSRRFSGVQAWVGVWRRRSEWAPIPAMPTTSNGLSETN